jgi:hypothetical protein
LKPVIDRVVERIVNSLDGEAKTFYQREFRFFDEVTSISGKLKPFIKKSKPEKKVSSYILNYRQSVYKCSNSGEDRHGNGENCSGSWCIST